MRETSRVKMRVLTLAMIVAGSAGCTSNAPPSGTALVPESIGPLELGLDWGRVASVERPANFEETVSPSYPGAHPILRIQGQATMTDLTERPGGGFVAVGYVPPEWQPVAWTSATGDTWTIHSIEAGSFTFPMALAAGLGGTIVAVGRSGGAPVAWTTVDGVAWERHSVQVLGTDGVAERMTTVVAGASAYVAGGSVGPELFERHARFWRSVDGVSWVPVADDPAAFANAEVRAITSFEGGFVAVGIVGTVQEYSGAVAWVSPDGVTWTRIDDPAFDGGEAVSVVAAPFGGLVAVGTQVDRRMAVAWTSPDGRRWTRAPSETSRQHPGGYAWMTDVTAIGDIVIAVGDIQGLQRGTAMSWVSRDGLSWARSNRHPVQEGAEFYAIAPGGPGAFVVGAFGAPDSYVPEVWLTPGR